ncbi:MAG: hypothetical protein WCO25_03435 [Candidatus Uhrbacteria bacterium]
MKRVWIIPGLIVVAAIAVAATILWSTRHEWVDGTNQALTQSLGAQSTPRQQTFQGMLAAGTSAVYVEDQADGSSEVAIGFAVMKDAGFVAVYDSEGGHPGKEIGRSALISAGGGEHLTVVTSTPLRGGEIYYAILLSKDGAELADADGNVTLMSFAARVGAEPETGAVQP